MADRLPVNDWTQHRRAFNKMADRRANQAMAHPWEMEEEDATTRPHTDRWTISTAAMAGDWTHWVEHRQDIITSANAPLKFRTRLPPSGAPARQDAA
jgi:hypothetical protein